jgi:hypothetical protein
MPRPSRALLAKSTTTELATIYWAASFGIFHIDAIILVTLMIFQSRIEFVWVQHARSHMVRTAPDLERSFATVAFVFGMLMTIWSATIWSTIDWTASLEIRMVNTQVCFANLIRSVEAISLDLVELA